MSALSPDRLSVELLLEAYRHGIFPMANSESGGLEWFSPDPRAVLPLDRFHVPRSLARVVRQGRFEIATDTCFTRVMRECAAPRRDGPSTWIDERLIEVYEELHRHGHAHSIEAWRAGKLVGGLYGVHIGAAFMGESMFSRPGSGGTNASKVCLVKLVELLRARRFRVLDTQFHTPHLDQFGVVEVPRDDYLARLADALIERTEWPAAGTLCP